MDREAAGQAWGAWVRDNIGGEPARQGHALNAVLDAMDRGANADQAAAAGRHAAEAWQPPATVEIPAPLPPAPVLPGPVLSTAEPAATEARPGSVQRWTEMFDDQRIVAALAVAAVMLLALAVVLAINFRPAPTEASKSVEQIVADSRVAMLNTGSYHAHVTQGRATQDIYFQGTTSMRQESTDGERSFKLLQSGDKLYLSGNAAFYSREPVLAQHAADQWLAISPNPAILDPAANTARAGAECILDNHGSLHRLGLTTINGRRAVEMADAGDKPGATPAHFFFAVDDGPTDLLRIMVTGPTRGGAMVDRCVRGFGIQSQYNRAGEQIDLLEINGRFEVAPPGNPVNLSDRPFCGDALNFDLPAEVQQYMLISYDRNLVAAQVEKECGCPTPTPVSLRLAYTDEIAGEENYAARVAQMTLATSDQRAARDRLVIAVQATINAERQALASGHFFDPGLRAATEAEGGAALAFRVAIGMGDSTCAYVRP